MTAHYQSMHAAVKMLISRIHALHRLVTQMQSGGGSSSSSWPHRLTNQSAVGRVACSNRSLVLVRRSQCSISAIWVMMTQPEPDTSCSCGNVLVPSCLSMPAGALPYDHQLVRQAAALVRRLPVLDTPQFHEDYLTVCLSQHPP